ncbi:MAG: enoyl-CoA hydratase-related protein [Acidimicrobiia bacterium]|nr:enoyl-CoA hydratase-related protein [Acidimicrobiia bacterium]
MSLVEYAVDGAVAIITLNRPPVNALSDELAGDLDEAVARAEDPAVRAVVITGDPHFAAGADIKGFQVALDSGSKDRLASAIAGATRRLERLAKPTIAAVKGYALGGGLELAMGADFRYLADTARVGQPEILLGIIPGAGGTQRLPRIVGFQKAKELNFSGRQVDAEEALAIGLADKVVEADDLLDVALADAREWATKATLGIGAAKRAMGEGWGRPIDEAMEAEADAFNDVFFTEDAREGVAAFIAKRAAEFQGR